MLKKMKNCPEHGPYPARFNSCPVCRPATQRIRQPLTIEQHLERLTDGQVESIFSTVYWESGTEETRQKCLAEYDKRIGLENWPEHIPQDGSDPEPLPIWK